MSTEEQVELAVEIKVAEELNTVAIEAAIEAISNSIQVLITLNPQLALQVLEDFSGKENVEAIHGHIQAIKVRKKQLKKSLLGE